jgi:opacity protein-like surface antigen
LEEDGSQSRVSSYQDLHARAAVTRKWILEGEGKVGSDISNSEYFPTENFDINYYQVIPKLNFQPNTSFRVTLSFTYSDKVNALADGGGSSIQDNSGIELKYNVLTKGSLTADFNYVKIAFNGDASSPLGLEILQGLNVGNNYTWSISYQCNLSGNIQLNLSYTGRDEPGSPIVNTGNASVRAFF